MLNAVEAGGGGASDLNVPQDMLQTLLMLRASLKQQVVNLNAELSLLDSQLMKVVKSANAGSDNNENNMKNNDDQNTVNENNTAAKWASFDFCI